MVKHLSWCCFCVNRQTKQKKNVNTNSRINSVFPYVWIVCMCVCVWLRLVHSRYQLTLYQFICSRESWAKRSQMKRRPYCTQIQSPSHPHSLQNVLLFSFTHTPELTSWSWWVGFWAGVTKQKKGNRKFAEIYLWLWMHSIQTPEDVQGEEEGNNEQNENK